MELYKKKQTGKFGPKKQEVIGLRELRNEELRRSPSTTCTTGKIKSRRIRWTAHVASIKKSKKHTKF
jgi:hypothetical protein